VILITSGFAPDPLGGLHRSPRPHSCGGAHGKREGGRGGEKEGREGRDGKRGKGVPECPNPELASLACARELLYVYVYVY